MKDLYIGLGLGFVIGALSISLISSIIDFGAFAQVQNIIEVWISDSVSITETVIGD